MARAPRTSLPCALGCPPLNLTHARTTRPPHSLSLRAPGLDHFFARVAPAKRYDQLDPEFNRGLLVGSITLAFVGTYALSVFAAQKTLAEQWK